MNGATWYVSRRSVHSRKSWGNRLVRSGWTHLHVVSCDQCVDASSREKSTPPMGAPNAAASPDATPADRKSRPSRSLKKVSSHARIRPDSGTFRANRCWRVNKDATHAPTCTSGPSGPTGSPDATEHTVPTTLTTAVRRERSFGTWTPLRDAITSATPAPVAGGATFTTSTEATRASAAAVDARTAHAARMGEDGADTIAAWAHRSLSAVRTVTKCSIANASAPITNPMRAVTHHLLPLSATGLPVARKLSLSMTS